MWDATSCAATGGMTKRQCPPTVTQFACLWLVSNGWLALWITELKRHRWKDWPSHLKHYSKGRNRMVLTWQVFLLSLSFSTSFMLVRWVHHHSCFLWERKDKLDGSKSLLNLISTAHADYQATTAKNKTLFISSIATVIILSLQQTTVPSKSQTQRSPPEPSFTAKLSWITWIS